MRVLKFGGTSVGIPAHAERALAIVRAGAPEGVVVVVSALSGVTNQLVEACRAGAARDALMDALAARHQLHASALGVDPAVTAPLLVALRDEFTLPDKAAALSREVRDRILS